MPQKTLPDGIALTEVGGLNTSAIALSPDGDELVYVGSLGGEEQLFLRSMDSARDSAA